MCCRGVEGAVQHHQDHGIILPFPPVLGAGFHGGWPLFSAFIPLCMSCLESPLIALVELPQGAKRTKLGLREFVKISDMVQIIDPEAKTAVRAPSLCGLSKAILTRLHCGF